MITFDRLYFKELLNYFFAMFIICHNSKIFNFPLKLMLKSKDQVLNNYIKYVLSENYIDNICQ